MEIKRNERGHRIYSHDDLERLTYIRFLKEQGLKLKAIKKWLEENKGGMMMQKEKVVPIQTGMTERKMQLSDAEKAYKMQMILQKMFSNLLEENNQSLVKQVSDTIKENMTKEFDYQIRVLLDEEDKREESRKEQNETMLKQAMEQQEEHFKKLDELLRKKNVKQESGKKDSKWIKLLSNG